MFVIKNILRIQQFDFEDGKSQPRDKYLIVLFVTGEDAIIAPLTTSVDKVPDFYKNARSIKDDSSRIHCYFIPKKLSLVKPVSLFQKTPLSKFTQPI